ncbi:MAG: hypothetical protein ABR941_10840, partial [Thermoleophilia bacterium]
MPVTTPLVPVEAAELLLDVVPLEVEPALLVNEPPLLLLDEVDGEDGLLLFVGVGLGLGVTVKRPALVAVPPELVTVIGPLPAPAGTMAERRVSLTTLKNAARPLKLTAVAPVKPLPVRVTLLPTGPAVGVKLVSVGVGVGDGVGDGDAVSLVVIARSVANMMSALPAPFAV